VLQEPARDSQMQMHAGTWTLADTLYKSHSNFGAVRLLEKHDGLPACACPITSVNTYSYLVLSQTGVMRTALSCGESRSQIVPFSVSTA
jgi:hypothetical protein